MYIIAIRIISEHISIVCKGYRKMTLLQEKFKDLKVMIVLST